MDAHVNGTIGSPSGTVDASASNGLISGEKYDAFTLQARMTPDAIAVPTLTLTSGAARIAANATFQHPVDDLKQGSITAHIAANQVQLAQFQSLVKDRPGLQGAITLNGDAAGSLQSDQFTVSSLNANFSAHGLAMQGKTLGDVTATANTAGQDLRYSVTSDFAGSAIRVNGQSALAGDHRTTASASIANLPIDRALAIAGQPDVPVKGTLSATAQVSGTLQEPQAAANFTVVNGNAYQVPFTRLETNVNYAARAIDVPQFHLQDGPASIDASFNFTHPAGDLSDGDVRVRINSNQIQLASLQPVQQSQPGLAGAVQITADAAGRLRKNAAPEISTLNANLRAAGVSMNKQNLGDLTATAATRGDAVAFDLTSDLAHANIHGAGTAQLTAGYPVNARLTFTNVTYRGLAPLLSSGPVEPFDATVDGSVTVNGPVTDVAALNGAVELTKLEAHSAPVSAVGAQPRIQMALSNAGNIVAAVNRGKVAIQGFHLTGRDADFSLTGTASLTGQQALALRAAGNVNLELLEAFSPDIYSSGSVTLNANIAGTPAAPDLTGRLQLQKASFNLISLPNGLSNADGAIAFTGAQALIQNITGQSGGGKVTISGIVAYGGPQMQFHVQATANRVHVEYPPTITTQANATLALNGTSVSSLLTGRVSITDVALHQGADVGNVLTQAASPPSTSSGTTGPLAGLRLDVRIVTAPGAQFRTTLTENLQADAGLTLLGTIDSPGVLGRVSVTAGDVVFFGNKYTINQGTITFSDPNRVNPVMNVSLATTVQGIDVTLTVNGPMDQMKLAYNSDPPLQFQQIVSLLGSGSLPTTDPVLAAHSPAPPQQNLEQSGASAVLGQAVANPVAGRLQRLFGVTKLSIDPQIVGTNTAQATLTLKQQINRSITFTYIEDVTSSNPQIIRAEWAINPRYSAIAERDVNGAVIVDLFYKRRFR
jgi:translocation and assembly module TamB